jgi:branched-chain amino acid transport system substrate-binding protein
MPLAHLRRTVVIGAVVAVSLGVVAGCGSSSSGGSSAPPSGGGGTSTSSAASGTPIAVGNLGSYSGAQASGDDPFKVGIQAWASWTNAHGGINGHPIKLFVEDDALDATKAVAAVNTLINQDHVVAIVSQVSSFDEEWAPIAEKAGVPVIGGLPLDPPYVTNPDFFPTGANDVAISYGALSAAKQNGSKVAVLYCAEVPQCKQAGPILKQAGTSLGVTIPLFTSVSATSPDFTATCQAVKQSGAESYYVIDGPAIVQKIASTCQSQGVTAKLVEISGILTTEFAKTPSTANFSGIVESFPFFDTSTPATQEFHAAIKQFDPAIIAGKSPVSFGPAVADAWTGGQLFAAAVKASSASTTTASTVKAGLYALQGETLGGLTPPLTFTQGKPTLVNCYFEIKAVNGKFSAPNGLTPSCAPDALVSQVVSEIISKQ